MLSLEKIKKIFPYFYGFLLLVSFFYIFKTLNQEKLDVSQVEESVNETKEVKPVEVSLEVKTMSSVYSYEKRMQNTNTFEDLLVELMESEEFSYEKTLLTYGIEYDSVLGISTDSDYMWKTYLNNEDITYNTENRLLSDGDSFLMKYELR